MSAPTLASQPPEPAVLPPLPGPRGPLAVAGTIWGYLRDALGMHDRLVAKYGDVLIMDTLFGPVLHVSNPEMVRQIFMGDAGAFDSFSDTFEPLFGRDSVMLLVGERHQFERKILAPSFHGARVRSYCQRMLATAEKHAAAWKPGKQYRMQEEMAGVMLEIIISTVFGVLDEQRVQLYMDAARKLMHAMWEPAMFFKPLRLRLFGLGPWARFERAKNNLDALLFEDMKQRRESGIHGDDILSELVFAKYDDGTEMPYAAVRDEMVSMLMAGHDTSANVMAGALYELHQNPEVLAKLRAEIDTVPLDAPPDALVSLRYLDAVCKEVLRTRTPTSDVTRRLKRPMEVGGHMLPAGTGILIAVWSIHMREDLYPEPRVFRPERHLERNFTPYEHVAFGGGNRRCIGAAYSMISFKLALASIVRDYDMQLVNPHPVGMARRGIPFCQKDGTPMTILGRRSPPPRQA